MKLKRLSRRKRLKRLRKLKNFEYKKKNSIISSANKIVTVITEKNSDD